MLISRSSSPAIISSSIMMGHHGIVMVFCNDAVMVVSCCMVSVIWYGLYPFSVNMNVYVPRGRRICFPVVILSVYMLFPWLSIMVSVVCDGCVMNVIKAFVIGDGAA